MPKLFTKFSKTFSVLLIIGALSLSMINISLAANDPDFTGGSSVTSYSGVAAPITDLQVTGTGNPTVPVKLHVTSGSLAMSTTTGLTFTGSNTGATLQFNGTLNNVNAALTTLTYTRTGTGTDTLEATQVNAGEVFFPDNGHLYEYISYTSDWNGAKLNAATKNKYSETGYLATITSSAENNFVADRLLNAGWMGASDSAVEGAWKWVTGPEDGTQFWSGASGGSSVSGRYSNWNGGEPNDSGGNEDCGQFLSGSSGKWNDLPCSGTTLPGYVVEYGNNVTPLNVSSKNVSITTLAANNYPSVPSSLGPTNKVDASWSTLTTPILNFTLSDSDGSDTLKYKIQIDNNSNFSSPEIDYSSALAAQGAASFTVGQTAGSGVYTTGQSGQTLADGQYYWRIKAIDNHLAESAYIVANSGGVAFGVDTVAPIIPTNAPITSAAITNNTTPTWTWGTFSDSSSGLNTTYNVKWSKDNTFATGTSTSTTTSSSYLHVTPLAEETWYFVVTAADNATNSSPSLTGSVIIDTTAPTVPAALTIGNSLQTNDTTPNISWVASTDTNGLNVSTPYTIEWSADSSFGIRTTATSTTNNFTIPNNYILTDGIWYFRVKAKDATGNESAFSTVYSITIDTSVPSALGQAVGPTTTTNNTPTITWPESIDSGINSIYSIEFSQSEDFSNISLNGISNTNSYTPTSPLSDGKWYFRIKVKDAAGNESVYTNVQSFSINTVIPTKTPVVIKSIVTPILETITPSVEPTTIIPITTIVPTATSEPTNSDVIKLNNFTEYTTGMGKKLNLNENQKIYFNMDKEDHTVTVKEIHEDYVIVTIASTPRDVKVNRGEAMEYDVNNDGKNDISISFASINDDKADLTFKQLNDKPAVTSNNNYLIAIFILLILFLIVAIYIYFQSKKKKKYKY